MGEVVVRPRSVLTDMADKFQMEPAAFEATIRATCVPNGIAQPTKEEFAAFLLVAREHNLNPLLKEIYCYPRRGGGVQPMVAIDGWYKKINEHPQFDGFEAVDVYEDGKFVAVTCTIWRRDRSRPTIITEWLEECIRNTDPWKMKRRMLRHKAVIQCARAAFSFAGIGSPLDEDDMIDITPSAPPPRPKKSDYVAPQPEVEIIEPTPEDEATADRMAAQFAETGEIPDEDTEIIVIEEPVPLEDVAQKVAEIEAEAWWARDSFSVEPSENLSDFETKFLLRVSQASTKQALEKLRANNLKHINNTSLESKNRLASAYKARHQELPSM